MPTVIHPFSPIFNSQSEILILGSFPSVKSRENMFYYGNPHNRFWKILTKLYDTDPLNTIDDKIFFLYKNKIALWDVIESCEIYGSSDSSIKNVTPNDIHDLITKTNIKKIFVNGKTAEKYYNKYQFQFTGIKAEYLPSSSPANAKISIDELIRIWSKIKSTE